MDSPRVRAICASADVARAEALSAGRWPNPRLTDNRESAVGITEYISTVGQVLPITGTLLGVAGRSPVQLSTVVMPPSAGNNSRMRRAMAAQRPAFTVVS